MLQEVFVVGLDRFNHENLQKLGDARRVRFRPLFGLAELRRCRERGMPGDELIASAERQLRAAGTVDAIVNYWDFPGNELAAVLCRRLGLPSPSLESVLRCSHKYWSRLEQSKVTGGVPRFVAVDPFDDRALERIDLSFPFWLKPVRSFSSFLGFRIGDPIDFRRAIELIRREIGSIGVTFSDLLRRAEVPEEVAGIDGMHCIAEELISADHQCTLEGYARGGEIEIYGVVDSLRVPNSSSFERYEYPSQLPEPVTRRMTRLATDLIRGIGYDDAAFNIEFFYDSVGDEISVLEMNPRISQSHGELFQRVDGRPHHQVMLDIALGRRPAMPRGEGESRRAAKFFVRGYEDGIVTRVPSPRQIERLEREIGARISLNVAPGVRLSEIEEKQDSYSFVLAVVFLGGADAKELSERYERCLERLVFEIDTEPKRARGSGPSRTVSPRARRPRSRA